MEEHFCRHEKLDEVLAAETNYPLQQFYLIPWLWQFFAQHRREVEEKRSKLAVLYRWYFFLGIDVAFHLIVLLLSRCLRSRYCIRFFFRRIAPWVVIQRWKVVDKSQDMLTMEHELFRHIEIEICVKRSRLAGSIAFVTELIKHFDGDEAAFSSSTRKELETLGLWDDLEERRGSYTHNYQICVRRIFPDETLMSMASGTDEPYYSISFISYARPSGRHGFQSFAESLSRTMAALFDGRPHWGEGLPIDSGRSVSSLRPPSRIS